MVNWQKNDWNVFDIPEGIRLGYLNKNMMHYYDKARALENRSRSYPNRQINELTFKARGGNTAQWNRIIEREDRNRAASKRQSASIKAAAAIQAKPKPEPQPRNVPTKQNAFSTGSGSVNVFKNNKEISPTSKEGQVLQSIYDRQKAQRVINAEQKKLFSKVTKAKNYNEAFNIQEKSRIVNPNVGTFQQAFRKGELKETRGVEGIGTGQVVITNKKGDAMSFFNPSQLQNKAGKRVGTIDTVSVNKSFDFFQLDKPNISKPKPKVAEMQGPIQQSSFSFFGGMLEEQKPKQQEPIKDFFSGMTDPFYNIGMTFAAVPEATKRIVTTGDFFAGQKYFEKEVQPELKPTGFDRFFGVTPDITPAREAGTWAGDALAFFAPIPGSKAIKGIKMPNFFGSSKSTKKTPGGLPEDIFKFDTAEPGLAASKVKLGSGTAQLFSPKKTTPTDFFKAVGPKTKGGGTYKEYRATDFWKGPETKTGQILLQKTKVKTKQKVKTQNQLTEQFFKVQTKQKVKTKQEQLFKPVTKQKTKPMQFFKPITKQKTKQSPLPLLKTKPKVAQKQKVRPAVSFFPGTKTAARQKGSMKPPFMLPWGFFGGGGAGSGQKFLKKGKKSYTGWNVNPDTVGGFFKGPEYKTTRSTRAFKYYDSKRKRSKSKKTFYDNFF